jgi:2-polyprenyl-3-methyl-5-hydroxy-6-metoxy-1,4-benzoquinol methylase
MKEFWNQRYAEAAFAYGSEPNAFFAEQLSKLEPGKLLLPAEGEGRNALFAAKKGWQVDAFDYSESAQTKALSLAEQHGVEFNYTLADFASFDAAPNTYDLIALIYAHLPAEFRTTWHRKLLAMLKPGGKLILEAFHKTQLGKASGGPQSLEMLYNEEELRHDFAECTDIHVEQAEIELAEGRYHVGAASVIRLLATQP